MNRRFTQHEAFSLIEEYFQSGQRATDFYRSKNMSEWQFYKWRKLYLEVHPEHEASKTPPAKEPSLLQPVTVIGKPSSRRMPRFEIAYPGGVTLRVDEGVTDITLLGELLTLMDTINRQITAYSKDVISKYKSIIFWQS